ncbi:MAG: T9SS type A sorting domain-containing protein [Prevotellaceae bacterium]|jgi:hypothetical protein|nr:T9SS type A sorting domain-containing protein [Prevotellaceae bacterium]
MKKQVFLSLLIAGNIFFLTSQITIDGTVTDWNTAPVLSEPGVAPFAKVVSNGTSLFFLVTLDGEHAFNPDAWFTVDLYIDADFSKTTGQSQWVYNASGIDYLVQGPDLNKYTGAAGASSWSWTQTGSGTRAYSADAHSAELAFTVADFNSVALGETWGVALPYYYSDHTSGDPNFLPANNWDFANRKVLAVKPRTEVSLDNTAELTPANAYYNPFMKDENIAEYLDFQSGAYAAQNSSHWASWAVNLSAPATFNFKMTCKNTGSGTAKLTLVDRATNAVVKTFTDVWYPANADFTEDSYGTIDLSDVPAGKYMLKLTNPTTWDTFLKVSKVTLTNLNPTTIKSANDPDNLTLHVRKNGFSITSEKPADVYLYSTDGKLISNYKQIKSIDRQLPSGFYLLNIQSKEKRFSKRIVIK